MIGLIGYYRKFFPIFSDTIRPLKELTRKNVPFKWKEQYQRNLDDIKQAITTNPTVTYPDPDKQYYLFMDSSKYSWSSFLIQSAEQTKEDGTKIRIPHPIIYKTGIYQGSEKYWSTLQYPYVIYMSFHKMVFNQMEVHVMVRCDHALLQQFVYSVTNIIK